MAIRSPLRFTRLSLLLGGLALAGCSSHRPLASWNDGPARDAIINYTDRVTDGDGVDDVPPAERIAVFDNDGTLWSEQPAYFQLLFAFDRVKQMASQHPEWRDVQPYKAVLENDLESFAAGGNDSLAQVIAKTHAGMTSEEFSATARDWFRTARHPKTGRPYTEMVYQPMLELLDYLREHGFKTFIVSGGGTEFIRVFAEEVYGIPPEQVIGSSLVTEFSGGGDSVLIRRNAELGFVDDKAGKPVGIQNHIGRRPIVAFGNSDGDLQMLQWTAAGEHPSLCGIIHHTDASREYAYDRQSHIGQLNSAWDEARRRGWLIVDMRTDWSTIYPPAGDS